MSKLKLTDVEWGEFFIGGSNGLFDITSTKSGIDKNKLNNEVGFIPYITRTDMQNGINMFITDKQNNRYNIDEGNVITIGLDTQTVFYQPTAFYTGQNIQVLRNNNLNKYTAMFIIPSIKIQMQKFNWGGNGATLGRLNRTRLILPVNSQGKPNWQFMEDYIKQEQKQQSQKIIDYYERKLVELAGDMVGLDKVEWKEFSVGELFDIKIGKNIDGNKVDRVNGGTAYITRKENTNGLDGFVNYDSEFLNSIYPVITIGNETAEPYVQDFPFFTGTKVNILLPKFKMDISILKYIATSLRQHKGKYSYSFTINSTRLKKQNILLPADKNGNPNFQYMSDFVKKLELDKVQEVLEYIYIYIYQNDDHS